MNEAVRALHLAALEEQKQIAAKHVSMYYDVVQKLKTVMEETHYGQNV